jgi:hypothetical protein
MAKRDKREAGKTFLENILAKIPEGERATVQAAVMKDDVLDFAGEHHLRHDEFSRMADEVRKQSDALTAYRTQLDTYKGELDGWYTTNKTALEKVRRRSEGDGDLGELEERPTVDLSGYVRAEDHDRMLRETQEQGLSLMTLMTRLGMKHYHEFKEPLDPADVIVHARDRGLRLDLAYEDWVAPRREERSKKELEDRLKQAREEGAIEERKRQQVTPYPVGNEEPTTLSGLDPNYKKDNPVAAAVADYYERQRPT